MTTLALTDPPLKRLFERLDFALQPNAGGLDALMEYWRTRRAAALFPAVNDIDFRELEAGHPGAFLYRLDRNAHDAVLLAGGPSIERLLGSSQAATRLSRAPSLRTAVRLRRLFELVRSTGEPLLAEYRDATDTLDRTVELFVAPVSHDHRTVDAVLGGLAIRPPAISVKQPNGRHPFSDHGPLVFAIGASASFGKRICQTLSVRPAPLEERDFEDGEHKIRPLVSVRNRDVYVVHSLFGDGSQTPNDKLCRLLFLIGALKDAAVARVTAVIPYLCYARKDRQTKARDPITTRYVAQLIESVGTDRVITMEAHNVAAFQNAFRCDTEHLDANAVFVEHFRSLVGEQDVAVVSPDSGGMKRASIFREALESALGRPVAPAFMEKHRSMGQVSGEIFAGDVAGKAAIVIDDMISTGGTMARTAQACRERGATGIHLAATHGLFARDAGTILTQAPVDHIAVTDTVTIPARVPQGLAGRLTALSVAGVFAEAIGRCHSGETVIGLLAGGDATDQPSHRSPA